MSSRRRTVAIAVMLGWAVAYAAAMYAGRITRVTESDLSLVWPAAGVGAVWLLSTHGVRLRATAAAACLLAGFAVSLHTGADLVGAINIAVVITTYPIVAVLVLGLLGWRTARPPQNLRDVPTLIAASAAAGLASAVVGVVFAAVRFDEFWWEGAWQLSSRNTVSGFVVTVALFALPHVAERRGPAKAHERILLSSLTIAGTVGILALQLPVLYLLVPLTVMVAMRCGPHLTSALVGVQGVVVVVETIRTTGPLVDLLAPEVRVLLAQLLIMVLAVLALVLALEEQERFEALQRSRADKDRLRHHNDAALVANAHLVLRPGGRLEVTEVNPALASLCRVDRHHLLAVDPLAWFAPEHREMVAAAIEGLNGHWARAWRCELQMDGAFGGGWVDAAMSPVPGDADGDLAVTMQMLDITARKRAEDRLADLALHDQLTGLPNRVLAADRLKLALEQSLRTGLPVAVLYVDLDHFKQINDSHGHDYGDRVLATVAARLSAVARAHDTVARLGGDEFVVVCPSVDGAAQASTIARRFVSALSEPTVIDGKPIAVTASVGVTIADDTSSDVRDILRRADTAMYAAKEHGRGRFEVFNDETHAEAERSIRLLDELTQAFEFGEMAMEYQPIVVLATRKVVGVEALIRWRHPVRGVLAPSDFLDVVESSNLAFQLGEFALLEACCTGAKLTAAGHPLTVHVNLSARELERPGVVDRVRAVLEETGFAAEQLAIEVTESRMLNFSGSLLGDLGRLRALGIHVAVDDFGTRYSSPVHLVQMPLDVLKLDRSFVANIGERASQAVSAGVLAMARGLGVGLIAEGIETAEQEAVLMDMGYKLGQGFLYSAALPGPHLADWLRDTAA